jgi:16S rRNA G527 N7-methylase RsmG
VGEILKELDVKNVEMIWSRIEEVKGQSFDLVTARAVAYSDKLLNWATPLIKK